MKVEEFYSSYFLSKNIFGNDGVQNMFVYQSTFNMIELNIDKGTENVTG